jgi:hypothetical protein
MERAYSRILIGGIAAVLLAAAAERPPAWIDRKVTVDDPAVAAALKTATALPAVPERVARTIGPMLYADNSLTANESDLILELLDNRATQVRITTRAGESFDVPPLSAPARDFISLHDIPNLTPLWLAGPKEMKALVDVTVLNPHVVGQMEDFFGNQLIVSWRTAEHVRDRSYLTRTIRAAVGQFRLAGPDTERRGRALLYGAMVKVDAAVRGAVPDDVYLPLKPPQPAAPPASQPPARPAGSPLPAPRVVN